MGALKSRSGTVEPILLFQWFSFGLFSLVFVYSVLAGIGAQVFWFSHCNVGFGMFAEALVFVSVVFWQSGSVSELIGSVTLVCFSEKSKR